MDLVQVVEAVFVTETELQHLCRRQIQKVKFATLETYKFLYLRNSYVHLPGVHWRNINNTQGSLINRLSWRNIRFFTQVPHLISAIIIVLRSFLLKNHANSASLAILILYKVHVNENCGEIVKWKAET